MSNHFPEYPPFETKGDAKAFAELLQTLLEVIDRKTVAFDVVPFGEGFVVRRKGGKRLHGDSTHKADKRQWGDIFQKHVAKGMDHGAAAYLANEALGIRR